jgi:glyoxylase-like metal-dependent hydrolase (beta-lactamase superfamily II)
MLFWQGTNPKVAILPHIGSCRDRIQELVPGRAAAVRQAGSLNFLSMELGMKKILIIVGVVIGVLAITVVILVSSAFMGRSAIIDGFQSGPVRVVKDGIVSVAFLDSGDGHVALVDAGNDGTGKAILAELSRRNLGPDAVKTILLTHGHPDHVAAIPLFPNAEVMALTEEVALTEGRSAGRGPLHWVMPASPRNFKVTRTLSEGDAIQLGKLNIRVFAVPGHTSGSAAYLVEGVLIMGDSADMSSGGKLTGSPWLFSDNQAQNRASLVRLEQLLSKAGSEVKTVVFSHSGAVNQGLAPMTVFAGSVHQ